MNMSINVGPQEPSTFFGGDDQGHVQAVFHAHEAAACTPPSNGAELEVANIEWLTCRQMVSAHLLSSQIAVELAPVL